MPFVGGKPYEPFLRGAEEEHSSPLIPIPSGIHHELDSSSTIFYNTRGYGKHAYVILRFAQVVWSRFSPLSSYFLCFIFVDYKFRNHFFLNAQILQKGEGCFQGAEQGSLCCRAGPERFYSRCSSFAIVAFLVHSSHRI